MISKLAEFEVTHHLANSDDRYLFVKGSLKGMLLTLANMYFPDSLHANFCKKIFKELHLWVYASRQKL